MALPDNCDAEKTAEIAIGLLYLTIHGPEMAPSAWKGIDWDVMGLLHDKGWISNPAGKAKSVVLTDVGLRKAEAMFKKHFTIEAK